MSNTTRMDRWTWATSPDCWSVRRPWSVMHANNEVGVMVDLARLSALCSGMGRCCSDTVQTMGHYPLDLNAADVDFLACSAPKLHGPKGTGFCTQSQAAH